MNGDSITGADSVRVIVIDTDAVHKAVGIASYTSSLTTGEKPKWNDIEQQRRGKNDALVFFILVALLVVLTTLKLAFSNDFNDLFRSFISSNIALQIVRSSREDISLSSFLMNGIFVIAVSVYTRFIILHFYPYSVLQNNFSIVILIFLFTFFFVAKYALLRYIGNIFDISSFVDEYLFNISAIVRTIGISMIPILFMLYASSEKYFVFIFIASLLVLCIGVVMIVIRGLSTSYKLMYSSVYHFLIYICVGEILPIFLFFKLLTKTAI
ncbi:MAG: hypothetical protein JWO03_244 [Bacteroidetes bacterium]|nr:hypothetical protein [Bacteroidota bacterium]